MEIEHSRYQKNGNWTFSEKKLRLAACLSLNSLKAAGNLVGLLKYSNLNQLFPQRTYLKRELLISVNQKFYNTYNLRILELYVQFPQNISCSIPIAKRWRTYNLEYKTQCKTLEVEKNSGLIVRGGEKLRVKDLDHYCPV